LNVDVREPGGIGESVLPYLGDPVDMERQHAERIADVFASDAARLCELPERIDGPILCPQFIRERPPEHSSPIPALAVGRKRAQCLEQTHAVG
jgi:hypothetical protein